MRRWMSCTQADKSVFAAGSGIEAERQPADDKRCGRTMLLNASVEGAAVSCAMKSLAGICNVVAIERSTFCILNVTTIWIGARLLIPSSKRENSADAFVCCFALSH